MVMKKYLFFATLVAACLVLTSAAEAHSGYDGSWDLIFVTQRGACDSTYNFSVNITNGIVTHPNLVKFRGYVARSGAVRASVTVQGKFASGSGKLTGNSGRGAWSGHSGQSRCSGYWTAQRN
jgi:hypothetical protein